METYSRRTLNVNHQMRLADFAEQAAAEEFGGRYFGWRQWDTFRDISPAKAIRKRMAWLERS